MSTTQLEQRSPIEPLAPLDTEATKRSMEIYQQGLHALLDNTDWQTFQSRNGEQRFLKRSGWRKIALWFNLNIETRQVDVEREDGRPVRARVIARAIAPNGRYADGEGGCGLGERPFSKPEHDLPATAATRAINRAISNLVGLGAVSAEELDTNDNTQPEHIYGPAANSELAAEAAQAVQKILPGVDGFGLMRVLQNAFKGELPEAAARALTGLAWWVDQPDASGNVNEQRQPEPTPDAQE